MDFFVSGLVVDGHCLQGYGYSPLQAMEPDSSSTSPSAREREMQIKKDLKKEKNRQSSAKSRQRKKEEDEGNQQEIERLESDNKRLRQEEERILAEGRALMGLIGSECFHDPDCPGCSKNDNGACSGLDVPEVVCEMMEMPADVDSFMDIDVNQNS